MTVLSKENSDRFERLKKLIDSVNNMIEGGSFYGLPYMKRHAYVHKIKQLYNRLLGPLTSYELTTAIAGLSLIVFGATACAKKDNNPTSPTPTPTTPTAGTPAAPSSFTATAVASNQIDLLWSNLTNELGFRVYRNTIDELSSATWLASTATNVTNYSDTELENDTTYYYWVEGTNLKGAGASATASATTFAGAGSAPSTPTPLTATALTSNSIRLSWNNVANETNYRIYRNTVDDVGTAIEIANLDADITTYTNTGLNSDTTYYYWVQARNSVGDSSFATANATTPEFFGTTAFASPTVNPDGLAATLGYFAGPAFADLDGDGDYDMMSYASYSAYTLPGFVYYENTGSATAPAYGTRQLNPFSLAADLYGYNRIALTDLDNDGDVDMMVLAGNGQFHYYENTGTSSSPTFAAYQNNPFSLATIGYWMPSISFVDLDNDGDQDIMACTGKGYGDAFIYFQNTGSASSPSFAAASTLPFGLTSIGAGPATTAFADLDGDSDLDMLSIGTNVNSTPSYFENTGSPTSPAFAAPVSGSFGLTTTAGGKWSSITFVDIDGDGDEDIFMGLNTGNFAFFEDTRK